MIKIDVEGFEPDVLIGGESVIRTLRPEAILFELNERRAERLRDEPVIKILAEFGYGFFFVPKCLFRMHLERFDPNEIEDLPGHDFVAAPKGECYERISELVDARRREL